MAKVMGRNYKAIKKAALQMYSQGIGCKTVADALGITMATVNAYVRQAGMPVHNPRIQEARKRYWQSIHNDEREDEPENLPDASVECVECVADLRQPVVEDDDWGREMLKTLKAIADALGVAV